MKQKILFFLALLFPLSAVFAGENALFRHENSCLKLPPSAARTECIKKEREAVAAFERERKKEEAVAKRPGGERAKKDDLCYRRETTGELVCPN